MDNFEQQPMNQPPINQQPAPAPSKGMSIAALVCGILGIVGSWIPVVMYFTLVLAILGIVFGCQRHETGSNEPIRARVWLLRDWYWALSEPLLPQ